MKNYIRKYWKLLIIVLLSLLAFFTWVILDDNWLLGQRCLYDDGGFVELDNGDSYSSKDGLTVYCDNGELNF